MTAVGTTVENNNLLVKNFGKLGIILLLWLFLGVLFKTAWLDEDAYITFRTVDNFINGYGLVWNIGERVQTYTHPLWMFLLSAVYFFTREIFFSSILVSITVSFVTVLLLVYKMASSTQGAILAITILIFSRAFIDYSTSGLENPLSHLLFVIFWFIYFQCQVTTKRVLLLGLIAALAAVNRMDTLLFFLPALVYWAWKLGLQKGFLALLIGFLPFIFWEVFSVFYYGFPFPNTAYAKLYTNLDTITLIEQGLYYLLNSLKADPLTLAVIVSGVALPVVLQNWYQVPLAIGVILYLLYVVRIGGDFMSGRFLTVPIVGATILWSVNQVVYVNRRNFGFLIVAITLLGFSTPYPTLYSNAMYGQNRTDLSDDRGIEDGRAKYYPYASLLLGINRNGVFPDHPWAIKGFKANLNQERLVVRGAIGYFGFFAGPRVHIVDNYALGDPLLARLPPKTRQTWRIGHFRRRLPNGYRATLLSGHNQLQEKNIAFYYSKLTLATRGSLFDLNRLVEIWKLNSGKYDYLLANYPPVFQVELLTEETFDRSNILWSKENDLTSLAGIQINFNKTHQAKQIEIFLAPYNESNKVMDYQREYELFFFNETSLLATETVKLPPINEEGGISILNVPKEAITIGYNKIKIFPARGDNLHRTIYSVKTFRLLE